MPQRIISQKTKIAYLIGIKGVGITALAQILKARGYAVSGSDVHEKFFTDAVLKRHNIRVYEGFDAKRIRKIASKNGTRYLLLKVPGTVFIASSAYGDANLEIAQAKKLGLKILSYAETVGHLFNAKEGISVCGSHGKTTTSALLGYVFQTAGLNPSVVVGSEVPQFRGNALAGTGKHFITETDEYQNKLNYFNPKSVLLTNIDYDHPDFFKSRVVYRNTFRNFIKRLPKSGLLVACGDDPEVRKVLSATKARVHSYGLEHGELPFSYLRKLEKGDRWTAGDIRIKHGRWTFIAYRNGKKFGVFSLQIPGTHNVLNALGVIALADAYRISKTVLQKALAGFKGTRRRFERIGVFKGALLIDDYAHHPTEIKATLAAARQLFGKKRIIAVFHPHTYSRTKALFGDFARAFSDADEVLILDIYGSAREQQGTVSSADLTKFASSHHKNIKHVPAIPQAISYLKKHLGKNDVLITLGAGDVWRICEALTKNTNGLLTSQKN